MKKESEVHETLPSKGKKGDLFHRPYTMSSTLAFERTIGSCRTAAKTRDGRFLKKAPQKFCVSFAVKLSTLIGKRLIVAFIMVAVIASGSGVLAIFTTTSVDTNYGNALTNFGFAQGDIGKAMLMIADNRRAVRDIVSCTNQKYIDEAKADLVETTQKYANYAKAVEPTLTTAETKALYATAISAIDKYKVKRDEVSQLGDTTNPELSAKAREVMMEELDPLYEDVYNA